VPIHTSVISTPPRKANSTERGGRKISSLQPTGYGSGIAEVVKVRLPNGTTPDERPEPVGGVDSHQITGGGNQRHHRQDRHWYQPLECSFTPQLRRTTMQTYIQKFLSFLRDEEGASAIEYALLVALIALAITAGATTLGTKIGGMFNSAASQLGT
jgi:pilus assembly protein Flp/PilA